MLPFCEIGSEYGAACCRQKHFTSHHAWLPSLQDRPCTIKTIADLRRIPVEWSFSPAWWNWKTKLRYRSHCMCAQLSTIYARRVLGLAPKKFVPAVPNRSSWSTVSNAAIKSSNRELISVHCLWPLTSHHILWWVLSQCYDVFCMPTDVLAWRCWHREMLATEIELLFLAASIKMEN